MPTSRLHPEVLGEAGHQHVQVQLAHPRDDQLAGLLALLDGEGGVLASPAARSASRSFLRSERVRGSMATEMTGSGKCIRSSSTGNWSVPTESPVWASLKPTTAAMSPAEICSSWVGAVGVHAHQPVDPLALVLVDVVVGGAALEGPGVDAQVAEVARLAVGLDLEHQPQRRPVQAAVHRHVLVLLGVVADHRRHLVGRRQVVDDRVQQRLHPHVAQARRRRAPARRRAPGCPCGWRRAAAPRRSPAPPGTAR